jgi:hypothetical protein
MVLFLPLKILIASLEKIGWRKFQTFINKKKQNKMSKKIKMEVALNALNLLFDGVVDAVGDLYPSEWKKIEDALAQARAMIEINDANVQFLKRIAGDECTITDEEFIEVEKLIPLDEFDNERYEFIGNFTINDNKDEFDIAVGIMCCGIYTAEYVLKSGKIIYFGFDYGH